MENSFTFTGLWFTVICLVAVRAPYMGRSYDTTLSVQNGGPWGNWYYREFCQPTKFAIGFRLKIEAYQGSGDDTALNAVELICHDMRSISSYTQQWGEWTNYTYCPGGTFIAGFRLQVEGYQGSGDDTAANFMSIRCRQYSAASAVTEVNSGSGSGLWGTYGSWSNSCPDRQLVCGIRTKIELWVGSGDDTALNDIQLLCCDIGDK